MSNIIFNRKRRFYSPFIQRIPAPARSQSLRVAQNPKFVQLGAGTFNVTDTIYWNGANYITLRGAAPGQTILRFSGVGANTCGGNGGNICVGPSTFYYNGNPVVLPGGTNAATWS